MSINKIEKTISLYEKSLTKIHRKHGWNHYATAHMLIKIGVIYLSLNKLDIAANYYGEAVKIRKKCTGTSATTMQKDELILSMILKQLG
jgi:hypothetical protein